MRELGIIDEEVKARALADYLLTQDIPVRVVANRDGRFAVWVQNEDRLPQARGIFEEFVADPDAPSFQAATRAAREIRRRADEVEKQHRKNTRDLRDRWEGPLHTRAPLTAALVAACVAAFVAQFLTPLGNRVPFWLKFSLQYKDAAGFRYDTGFANILHGEVWRLVTPIFLHDGIPHILFNMLALAALGQQIEVVRGRWRLLGLVLASALVGNVGQFFLAGGDFVGISGVVFGLAGYCWIKGQTAPEQGLGLNNQAAQLMFGWLLLGIVGPTLFPDPREFPIHMANGAHVGGLIAGMVLALLRF